MNLSEWLWKNKVKQLQLAREINISHRSIEQYIKGSGSAGLLAAIKINLESDERVSFIDLLSLKDMDELENFIKNSKKLAKNKEKIDEMIDLMNKSRKIRKKIEE